MQEVIKFEWLGLHLQEPMGIIMNFAMAAFSFFAFFKLKRTEYDEAGKWWKLFYLTFGISTVFGGLGHGLFYYFQVPGKFPCWITGCLANVFCAKGILSFSGYQIRNKALEIFIWSKSLLLVVAAMISQKFIFVAIDAILTYLTFTGGFALALKKRGLQEMKYMVLGVIVLLPSAFVFLLKINIHRWFDKNDLSHVFMLGSIICFLPGIYGWNIRRTKTQNV